MCYGIYNGQSGELTCGDFFSCFLIFIDAEEKSKYESELYFKNQGVNQTTILENCYSPDVNHTGPDIALQFTIYLK